MSNSLPNPADLEIQLLGGMDVRLRDGQAAHFDTRKSMAILAILASKAGATVSRERLAGLLWGDMSEAQARVNLRQSLVILRRALRPSGIPGVQVIGENVFLDPSGVSVDLWRFEAALEEAGEMAHEAAMAQYGGDFLDGFSLPEDAFEGWLRDHRARLREFALDAFETQLKAQIAAGESEKAVHTALRLLTMDPLREDLHRHLMRLYWEQDRRVTALEQYERCRKLLKTELDEEPDEETHALYQVIRHHRTPPDKRVTGPATETREDSHLPDQKASEEATTPERQGLKEACILLVELLGFEDYSRLADPEASQDVIQRFYDLIERAAVRFGGRPEGLFNGVAQVSFGVPRAHGNDAARALGAAEALVTSFGDDEMFEKQFQLRCAVTAGTLLWREEAEGWRRLSALVGGPIAEAHHLLTRARSGDVLANAAIHESTGRRYEFEALRGVDDAAEAWRLVGNLDSKEAPLYAPFMGRETELGQFEALLTSCRRSQHGQCLYLRGPAGIGKTRLVEQLIALADSEGFAAHKALVLDFGATKEKEAITALTCSLLNVAEEFPSVSTRRRAAKQCLAERQISEGERGPLNDLLALPQPIQIKAAYESLGTVAREAAKQAVLTSIIAAACRRSPIVLVIEDIHWAPTPVLDHLAQLRRSLRDLPVLLTMTARSGEDPLDQSWYGETDGLSLTICDIAPLDAQAARKLALAVARISEEQMTDCINRAQGNPFILEQLLHHAEASRKGSLPHSLQNLVSARLDRLSGADRAAIEAAAVLGQRFTLEGLRHLLDRERYGLEELVTQRLVRKDGEAFLFAHALLQEGAYEAVLPSNQEQLHRRAATWFASRDATLAALHLDRAGAPEAARAYLEAAKEQAVLHRIDRALELLERGLSLCRDKRDLHDLHAYNGSLHGDLGSPDKAVESYRLALDYAANDLDRCRALIGISVGVRATDDNAEEAMAALSQAEEIATRRGLLLELAQIHVGRGNIHFPRGEIDAGLIEQQRAGEFARRAGSVELECRALSGIADAYYTQGRMITSHANFERCVALARQHDLKGIEVANIVMVGDTLYYLNQIPAALDCFMAGISEARKVGHLRAEMVTSMFHFDVLPPTEARPYHERGLALARQIGARRYEPMVLVQMAASFALEGDHQNAIEAAEEACRISHETGPRFMGPWALGALALVSQDAPKRLWALDAGEALLAEDCVSHNAFWFYHHGIEVSLELQNWERVERYAAALEDFTAAEPVPWSDFIIARGRQLAAFGRGERSKKQIKALRKLRDQAETVGRPYPIPKLDEALKQA